MPIVIQEHGQLRFLDAICEGLVMFVFPYSNDRIPKATDAIGLYTEADFSGYSGPQPLDSWNASEFSQSRAVSRHPPMTWTQNGGPIDNLIFGVCVVDEDFALLFAERDPRAPVIVRPSAPYYVWQPELSLTSEYGG